MAAKPFASSQDLAAKEQTLEVLADGVYALTAEGDPNIGAIEGEDFLVCFEALATPVAARKWLATLREHTDKPVRYLVLSHYHAVRVLGASAFDAEVIVAHENTRALIAERGKQDWESEFARMPRLAEAADSVPGLTWPTLTFSDRLTIDLGGDRGDLVLQYHGRGHTEGDIIGVAAQAPDPLRRRPRGGRGRALHRRRLPPRVVDEHPRPDRRPRRRAARRRARRRQHGSRRGRGRDRADPRLPATHCSARSAPCSSAAARSRRRSRPPTPRSSTEFGRWPIFEHCLPFDVSRIWDELAGSRASDHLDRRARPGGLGPAAGLSGRLATTGVPT